MNIDNDDDGDNDDNGDADDVKTCRDLDECSLGNPCVEGECHNLEGGYRWSTLLYLSVCLSVGMILVIIEELATMILENLLIRI